MAKKIFKVVLTGGPCAGKTSALAIMEQELSNKGYTVLLVPETATEIIKSGLTPGMEGISTMDFQRFILKKQLMKEQLYSEIAKTISAEKIIIIYDRGIIDAKAYITNEEFEILLNEMDLSEIEAKERYDAVIHLVTAAKGAEKFYTLGNNEARHETLEEAIVLDNSGIKNWTGHSHLRIIDNSTNFYDKITRVLETTYALLGDPIPIEIERKYLVKRPNINSISKEIECCEVEILQTYLKRKENDTERRVRQRGIAGKYTYYYTEKKEVSPGKRIEKEKHISEREYVKLLSELDTSMRQIYKKRLCFVYENQYFELDLYSFSEDKAMLEIELTKSGNEVSIPPFIEVIEEVTNKAYYKNCNIAIRQEL